MGSSVSVDAARADDRFSKKQRLLSKVAFIFAMIITGYTTLIFALMPGFTPAKGVAVFACFSLATISWLSRHKAHYYTCAIGVVTITVLAGFGASLSNGGIEGYVAPILITAPIFAALFLGARATLYAAGAVVFAFVILYILRDSSLVKETPYTAETTSFAALVMLTTAMAICASGLSYFARESEDRIVSLTAAQKELVELANELHHTAHHDALTGIANRVRFNNYLNELTDNDTPDRSRLCVIHIDLDKFKSVNDTHGHPVGDGVLRKAAKILQRNTGDDGLVARVGGDEFVIVRVLSTYEDVKSVQTFCENLIAQISAPILINGIECHIGASIGYVLSDTGCGSASTLVKNADTALYDAKRAGRGVARQFTGEMRAQLERRRARIEDLESAFDDDRITCVLQPQVSLHTGALLGIEALGRVRSRAGHLLAPADFLDVFLEINRLSQFDLAVMRKAFSALVQLRNTGFDVPHISINASASSLRNPNYLTEIEAELASHYLRHHDIVVEVLESIFIQDRDDSAAKTIAALHELGIKTVMDDFGSGHASMSSLLQLKVSGIKIDQSLVADIDNKQAQQMIQAALSLSKNMPIPAIVEGIETEHQYAVLRALGCSAGQGYGICEPLELGRLTRWLESYGQGEVSQMHSRLQNWDQSA